jgi:2-aminoadipate transaminase
VRPKGGFFIWLEFLGGIAAQEVFEQAMEAGVAFIPGAGFCLDGGGRSEARLSYSREPVDVLARGAEVLGKIATKAYAQNLR